MANALTGPSLEPRSGKAKQLVVILHGFGADGNDLIDLGREWGAVLPDAAFVAPHAHEVCEHMPSGRQWFRLTDRNPHERWAGASSAGPVIDAYLDKELAARGLDDGQLALVGFSQGAMMALHVGLRRRVRPAGVLAYSGLLLGPEHLPQAIAGRAPQALPPIFLVHGSHDEVVPVESLFVSANQLGAAGAPCQWHLSMGLGHGIDGPGLAQGAIWLARSFGLPFPAALAPAQAPARSTLVS
jgi:phospholipase/carboxylesterase